ncbi:MAG TPA: hypothetical protein VF277_06180 [Steroidobacteraceae bacterium]
MTRGRHCELIAVGTAVLIALWLTGCGDMRVRESKVEATLPAMVAPIVVGETDRAAVRLALGEPWLHSDAWRFDLFRVTDRTTAVAFIIVPVWVGSDDVHGYVLVAYDEQGKVKAHSGGTVEGDKESGRSLLASSESSSALITAGDISFAVNAFDQTPSVAVSPTRRDAWLAQSRHMDGQCLLMLGCVAGFCQTGIAIDAGPTRSLPGGYVGHRNNDHGGTELWQQPWIAPVAVSPGVHRISVLPPRMATLDASAEFTCAAGEVRYGVIDVRRDEGMHWKTALVGEITIERKLPQSLRDHPMVIWRDGEWLVPARD